MDWLNHLLSADNSHNRSRHGANNQSFDIFTQNCVTDFDSIACVRGSAIGILSILTAVTAFFFVFSSLYSFSNILYLNVLPGLFSFFVICKPRPLHSLSSDFRSGGGKIVEGSNRFLLFGFSFRASENKCRNGGVPIFDYLSFCYLELVELLLDLT